MTLEEEFQAMMKASYSGPVSDIQVIDMRRAFMGGVLIGLRTGLHGGLGAVQYRNELLDFMDMVG